MENSNIMNPLIYGLAGLLHDVGKFGQRADIKYDESEYLSDGTKGNIQTICKLSQGDWYSHQHVLWTQEFIDRHFRKFKNSGLANENDIENNLANLASYHHVPTTKEQGIITLADWWSSGLDRSNAAILERNPDWGKNKFRSVPLVSCFPNLSVDGNFAKDKNYVYEVMKFTTTEKILPKKVKDVDNKALYKQLWEQFNLDFERIPDGSDKSFIYTIYHLLKLYTWYMPGSTMDYPDISLFEHLKISGAFAHCLAAYYKENSDTFIEDSNHRLSLKNNHYPVKLWCGDVSGIQNFIYSITNKSAVKSLKGRSMYVQLLAETVANEMLEVAGASIINTVYAAGGKFYLLLPNTKVVNEGIDNYIKEFEDNLWNKFHGSLSINIGSIGFAMQKEKSQMVAIIEGLENIKFTPGQLWKQLADKVSAKKRKRFEHTIIKNFESVFNPIGVGGNIKTCAVTGIEVEEKKENILDKVDVEQGENPNETIYVSPIVKEQIELGKKLVGHKYLTQTHKEDEETFKIGKDTFWKVQKEFNPREQYREKSWVLTNWDDGINFIPDGNVEKNTALGFRLYGGANVAVKESKDGNLINKSFEELLFSGSETEDKFSRLAVLRLDIDNLGELFMKGFVRPDKEGGMSNQGSFSALATLSTQLDVFFSGYVNHLRNKECYKDNINIIYSGGDDLFAVGKWDKIIAFAEEVRNEFRKYVCNREDISLSGGIAMVRPKFPIAKAADLAGEAEHVAKEKEIETGDGVIQKNAITLFEVAINWEKEWEFVKTAKDDLVKWIDSGLLSKGILMRLFVWFEQERKGLPDWKWQSAYSLARQAKSKEDPKQKESLNQIKNLIYTGHYKSGVHDFKNISFETFIAACRWAELELRNLKN